MTSPGAPAGFTAQLLPQQTEAGERVLAYAVKLAQLGWGNRLVAAYALGSLAHGGFSVHVSDVDLGLILSPPLDKDDAKAVGRLVIEVSAADIPLAGRLSVFWGSMATLSGTVRGGRFPPLDILDLKQFGRLLAGRDILARLRMPTEQELVISGAEFALQYLSKQSVMAYLENPTGLASAGVKKLTKLILFPVRLLFTARTGQIGMNDRAVHHFSTVENGPAAELTENGLAWRNEPPEAGDPSVLALLQKGLLPLYRIFLSEYKERLQTYGELQMAQAYGKWRQRLENLSHTARDFT